MKTLITDGLENKIAHFSKALVILANNKIKDLKHCRNRQHAWHLSV